VTMDISITGSITQEPPVSCCIVFDEFAEVEGVELESCLKATLLVFSDSLCALVVYG
jgi:hypothetical protein